MRRHEILKRFAGLIAVFMLAAGITAVSALAVASNGGHPPRSGALHVTKECSEYNGQAGSFCTITSSNIAAIKPGMRVVYLQTPGNGVLDTDIVLSFGRRPAAFGHVVLDLTTRPGPRDALGRHREVQEAPRGRRRVGRRERRVALGRHLHPRKRRRRLTEEATSTREPCARRALAERQVPSHGIEVHDDAQTHPARDRRSVHACVLTQGGAAEPPGGRHRTRAA